MDNRLGTAAGRSVTALVVGQLFCFGGRSMFRQVYHSQPRTIAGANGWVETAISFGSQGSAIRGQPFSVNRWVKSYGFDRGGECSALRNRLTRCLTGRPVKQRVK